MTARELLSTITDAPLAHGADEIIILTEDARLAGIGSVFVCIKGAVHDGADFAPDAYRNGCRIFVAERALDLPGDAEVLRVPDAREALSRLACRFYGHPDREMHLVGITGTKGKTTTALMLFHILNSAGIACGYIGTNGVRYCEVAQELPNTTPAPATLQKHLRQMADRGVRAAVIEVSSQALLCKRAEGMRFETALFTNLSPDHIGQFEHRDFDDYKACKKRLFTDFGVQNAIYNADDAATAQMLNGTTATRRIATSVQAPHGEYRAADMRLFRNAETLGVTFSLCVDGKTVPVKLPLIGKMNVENALLAIATAVECFGVALADAVAALATVRIEGRGETVPLPNGALAVIDYAHNGESMRRLLSALREYRPARLITLFGSVGGRSQMRRAELGEAAAAHSDLCVLTSDNPAGEAPEAIIADIARAFAGTAVPYLTVPDRREAIFRAVELTHSGDILVLAGKGHEDHQLVGKEKRPFCEREILAEAAKLLARERVL